MNLLYNSFKLKYKRRALRVNQTDAERLLWRHLRNKQVNDLKFFRQYSVGSYILDFYCPAKRLAIEVDGSQHDETKNQIHDKRRSLYLEQQGITVIRFWNNEVLGNIEGVIQKIEELV